MQDLRNFLFILEQQNDLVRIKKEVDRQHEVAAVLKRGAEQDGPALIFENVRGSDIPLVANVMASRRRVALALGTTPDDVLSAYRSCLRNPIAPVKVRDSAHSGNLPNLSALPIIKISELDAGPYITAGVIFAAHPQTGKINLSFQRMCPISDRAVAIYAGETSDIAEYGRQAPDNRLPVVVAIGLHPAFLLVAGTRFPPELEEIELVGGLLGEGARLTQTASGAWLVPEAAEIVLEGVIDFKRTVPEGPFGEYPGYYGAGTLKPRPSPVLEFQSIRCKSNPIYQTLITGPTIAYESTHFSPISKEAMLFTKLTEAWPSVTRVSLALSRYIAVVQVNGALTDEEAKRLMGEVFLNSVYIKYVILTDEDIDAASALDVLWGLSTRVDPGKNMHVYSDMKMEPLDPSTNNRCDKLGFDARKPIGGAGDAFVRTRIPGYETTKLEDYFVR